MTTSKNRFNRAWSIVNIDSVAIELLAENAFRCMGKQSTESSYLSSCIIIVIGSQLNMLCRRNFVLSLGL
jgi:hypothetical protein